jgi:hypothetical protein
MRTAAPAPAAGPESDQRSYAVVNGRWFDGRQFVPRSWWIAGGVLRASRPARVDSVIDLAGAYVIPPFGEAHNHNVESPARADALIARYLRDGVFYVKNPNNLPRARAGLAGRVNTPASIDVAFANGGLTSSGGHPVELVRRNIARGAWTAADGEGAFFWAIDDRAALDRQWPAILAGRPDFLKTYLLYSEEYARRRDDTTYVGWRGLDPALLPEIVRRAHRAGLRVSTHVETAADFRAALAARADEINHVPGFRGDEHEQMPADTRPYEVTDADAARAARQGIVVVTTLGGFAPLDPRGRTACAAGAPTRSPRASCGRSCGTACGSRSAVTATTTRPSTRRFTCTASASSPTRAAPVGPRRPRGPFSRAGDWGGSRRARRPVSSRSPATRWSTSATCGAS